MGQLSIRRYKGRYWAVYEDNDHLLVVAVYKRGAQAVCRRIAGTEGILSPPEPKAKAVREKGVRKEKASPPDSARPYVYPMRRKGG